MKKVLFFIVAIILLSLSASAQINKGSSYLGADFGLRHSKSESTQSEYVPKSTDITVSSSIGFAYKENRMWGLALGYSYSESENAAQYNKYNTYSVGGFLRQYKPMGKGFYLFAHEALDLNYVVSDSYYANTPGRFKPETYSVSVSLSPGIAYDVSSRFQLELRLNNLVSVNYSHEKAPDPGTGYPQGKSTRNSFTVGSDLNHLAELGSVRIGARLVFGRSK